MTIYVVHRKRSGLTLPGVDYVGRPHILGNRYTHLDKDTLAEYKVATVEEAVACYRADFYKKLQADPEFREEVVRLVRKYQTTGQLILACWCKDELAPRKTDHVCHCDVIREFILLTLPPMTYYQQVGKYLG